MTCMIEFPLTNEGAKVKKLLTDFLYFWRSYKSMRFVTRLKNAWHSATVTLL